MKKAIVFAGGGSKGAYQVGAWKALNELGETFQIATGTSIGSINAGLYVQHDFDAAYEMWTHLKVESIMKNGINFDKSFESIFSQRENLVPFIKKYISAKGADVRPFHNALKQYFDADRFFSSDIDYALVTCRYPSFDPVVITKKDVQDRENMWQWMAASGACFPVFPVMRIGEEEYVDGGYYDNIPVAPAFRLGAKSAVVIDLKQENNHEGYLHHPRVTYIKPSRDLGTFLNFEKEAIRFSISLGYNDTMKVYGKYLGRVYTFIPKPEDEELLSRVAGLFLDLLTEMEARFDFSYAVKIQRINKFDGCTTLLADAIKKERPTETQLFLEATEFFLRLLEYDPDVILRPGDLLYSLKAQVDGMYPLLEYDYDTAFANVKKFVAAHSGKKNEDAKKLDDNRYLLIAAALIRALQRAEI
ncbi:MAG: patatin-like phospholipase family protein [Clostridia bacterium]|nr:patatin-like phospholipase family protein [Clostridia bacterium]MBR0510011.1 patatin-like phospholipase family protein [Clostridia bacterium]